MHKIMENINIHLFIHADIYLLSRRVQSKTQMKDLLKKNIC